MSEPVPVLDITEADFASWKHHPVTKVYLRYVLDYAGVAKQALADSVLSTEASLDQLTIGKLSGRILAWQEMATLELAHIAQFYTPETEEESNAA
jgi:hypothetical protein